MDVGSEVPSSVKPGPVKPGPVDVISAGIVIADCVACPVRRLPLPGQLALVDEISLFVGGSAANTAVALARLGLRAAVVGRVGADGFGDFLLGSLGAAGCDTRFLHRGVAPTSATLVNVDASGERSFLHAMGANAVLSASDLPLELLAREGARALHVAGYYVLPGLEPGLPDLLDRASRLGLLTSLDNVWNPSGDRSSSGDTDHSGNWERIHACLPLSDLFCPSLHEARQITRREQPADVVDALLGLGVRRMVALKMGEHGALIGTPDGARLHLRGLSVPVIDGTGAGDAFIGGVLAGLLAGETPEGAGRLGNAAGALCVGAMGAAAGLRDLDTTRALAATVQVEHWNAERPPFPDSRGAP